MKKRLLNYDFEWDHNKAKLNIKKHKISFEDAAEVFLDPLAVSLFDDQHNSKEDRWVTVGKNTNDQILHFLSSNRRPIQYSDNLSPAGNKKRS